MLQTPKEKSLLASLEKIEGTGESVKTTLETDDRVLARISDGIYRQPASALRELITNAYDADATTVIIRTDYPRFEHISIKDDGSGMDRASLVRMLNHIGGSPKRTTDGVELGVTSSKDPSLSPNGRRLIGKIGIGLFSVAQLSRHFQIITKQKGQPFRLVADIQLRTYSEEQSVKPSSQEPVAMGDVTIRSVPADDRKSHGTEIIIRSLHRPARDLLRSRDDWERLDAIDESLNETADAPRFHIGKLGPDSGRFEVEPELPWDSNDTPERRFYKMHKVVMDEIQSTPRPKLSRLFDRYLQMIWTLSLAAPLDYIDGIHPFDLKGTSERRIFLLSNDDKSSPKELEIKSNESIRSRLAMTSPERGVSKSLFNVFVDDVKLSRPLRFSELPSTDIEHDDRRPILFAGKYTAKLDKIPDEYSGGRELSFEAYFLWTPKVVPVDHNGVMVRIGDASGTLFDSSFFGYQVAEHNRLSQLSAEIFITKGLEAALNIDRESFNFGHPHTKLITAWVHRAVRQIATARKGIEKIAREHRKGKESTRQQRANRRIIEKEARELDVQDIPQVEFKDPSEDDQSVRTKRRKGIIVLDRKATLPDEITKLKKENRTRYEKKIQALAQLLEVYGLFSRLSNARQQTLLHAIAKIFIAGEE
ncbi:MAG: ATP-binding protein [Myxococcales bacterium]|nr:ATP-binding protein [Myxococcales bacterium]